MRDLRKRAADISAAEAGFCRQARARLEHLCEAEAALARYGPPGAPGASARGRAAEGGPEGDPGGSTLVEANERNLELMLADHVLRAGHLDTARLAAAEGGLEDLVDLDIFGQARGVAAALRSGSCREALDWCAEHAARLRRGGSRLEFRVRKQEFLELVRQGQATAALAHARKDLVPLLDGSQETRAEFQQAMATLVYARPGGERGGGGADAGEGQGEGGGRRSPKHPYTRLFEAEQWGRLADLFWEEMLQLHGLPAQSLLTMHLHAGLAALNSPPAAAPAGRAAAAAAPPPGPTSDPLALPLFQKMAVGLPRAKRERSRLVCGITGFLVDEDNPPMVLSNGQVYSKGGLDAIARHSEQEGGLVVTCPRTGDVCLLGTAVRAFLA